MINPELLYRLVLSLGFILAGAALYWVASKVILTRAQARSSQLPIALSGRPGILYFTTPGCVPCKTIQRPAIRRLQEILGTGLEVIEIDATVQTELASQWGILSVPTTFVFDRQGKACYVNHGVARTEKLLDQIASLK